MFSVGLLGLVLVLPAQALDITGATAVFELDGNAVTNNTGSGLPDDWDRVCHSVLGTDCSTLNNANTSVVEFASQGATTGTTFTGGGSKDPIDISSWAWNQAAGGLPGKDILLNGFAARYTTPTDANCPSSTSTCSEIFFGMDRFDNSGDAQNGFWFLQAAVGLGSTKSGGGQNFTGVHMNGDVLVVSDFSIGGTTSTISVYEWNSTCTAAGKPSPSCADANLQLLQTSTAANCAIAASNAPFCGIVNTPVAPATTTFSPWPFKDKSGNTAFASGEFYEGGINLSAFPGLASECFASTLAESRSSTSTSATLKSFVLGGFGACGSGLKTHPQDALNNDITNGSISIGTGSVKVQDQAVVTVTGISTWSGSVAFFLCGPADLALQPSCISGGTQIGSAVAVNNGLTTVTSTQATITSAASATGSAFNYCWRGVFTSATTGVPGATDSTSTECFNVTPVTPTLTTSATITNGGLLPATISDTATLTGTANEPGSPVINPTTAGAAAGGTITFTAYGPNSCTNVAFGPTTVSVTKAGVNGGDGTYGPVSFTPTATGTYVFVASYNGDSPNTNAVLAVPCASQPAGERVTATDTSSVTSAQTWFPNDSATVTSGSGTATLNGTLTIQLYDGSLTCATGGTLVVGQSYSTPVTNASTATVSSNKQTTFAVSTNDSVSWLVTFASTDSNIPSSTGCESSSLTITN